MSDNNLGIWNQISKPDAQYMKKITGGRLSGMSDINPQWRYQKMTEVFGKCGEGWKFDIVKLWTEPGSDGQIMCFAMVDLFTMGKDWGEPIPGVGGSMLVVNEKAGPHTSDEGYKMAVTDALSTSMKMLGMAAEVYLGNYDGSKYSNQNPQQGTSSGSSKQSGNQSTDPKLAEAKEVATATYKKAGISDADVDRFIEANSKGNSKCRADLKTAKHWWWINAAAKSGDMGKWLKETPAGFDPNDDVPF